MDFTHTLELMYLIKNNKGLEAPYPFNTKVKINMDGDLFSKEAIRYGMSDKIEPLDGTDIFYSTYLANLAQAKQIIKLTLISLK
jgi:hypothetical protein